MAQARCITGFSHGGYRADVGDVIDTSHVLYAKWPSNFTQHGELTSALTVSVPAIADPETDSVAVDISTGGLSFAAAVGDEVVAIPQEALEADCLLLGAYVVDANSVEVVFSAKEGGNGVSAADKSFKFFVTDRT